jgi:DNA-binding HxlR family transcriptional regulator
LPNLSQLKPGIILTGKIMTRSSFSEIDCPIALAAEQLADKWKFVILRNAFNGMTRFDDFVEHLSVSTNVLAGRLSELVEAGILEKRPVPSDGRAVNYRLTSKGHDLFPMLIFLAQWSERWVQKGRGQKIVISSTLTGENADLVQVLTPTGVPITSKTSRITLAKGKSATWRQFNQIVANRSLS